MSVSLLQLERRNAVFQQQMLTTLAGGTVPQQRYPQQAMLRMPQTHAPW